MVLFVLINCILTYEHFILIGSKLILVPMLRIVCTPWKITLLYQLYSKKYL